MLLGKKRSTLPPDRMTEPPAPGPAPEPAAPPAGDGWPMQALMARYWILGSMEPTTMALVGYINAANQAALVLNTARVQAYGAPDVNDQALSQVVIPKRSLIALVPLAEAAIRSALQQSPPRAERAVIHAAPFVIRGSFRLPGEMPLAALFSATSLDLLIVTDAQLVCQLPGVHWPESRVPAVIVSKAAVQFYYGE